MKTLEQTLECFILYFGKILSTNSSTEFSILRLSSTTKTTFDQKKQPKVSPIGIFSILLVVRNNMRTFCPF